MPPASGSLSGMNISWKLTNLERMIGTRQTGHFTVYLRSPGVIKHGFPVIRHLLDSDLGKTVNGGHPRPEDEAESLEQERERDMWREAWCRNTESGEKTPLIQI